MGKKIVIALGGNALGNNLPEQMIAVQQTAKAIADLIEEGHEVIIAHGNGPQVGMIQNAMTELTRSTPEKYIPCPLSVCVAMSQGYIGYDLQNALRQELLEELLGGLGVIIAEVTAATSPEELAAALEKGVSRRNLLLVVGGLSRPDERNAARQAAKLLSQPLSSVNPPVFRNGVSLTADHGRPEGFFLESGRQSLLLLPDDPGAVEALFDRQVTELLQKKYGLSLAVGRLEQRKDPQRRARELQEEIKRSEEAAGAAARPASETAFGAAPGKPSAKKGKNSKKALPAFLLLLVLALALLAGLLLTHRLPEAEAWLRGSFPGLNW